MKKMTFYRIQNRYTENYRVYNEYTYIRPTFYPFVEEESYPRTGRSQFLFDFTSNLPSRGIISDTRNGWIYTQWKPEWKD